MLPDIGKISGLKFKPFDPLTAPGNVAIWDGATYNFLDANWTDLVSSFNIAVSIGLSVGLLNGFNTLIFDGISQFGSSANPNNLPPLTIYIVLRSVTWTLSDPLIDTLNDERSLYQGGTSPNLRMAGVGGIINSNPDLPVNSWGILTIVDDGANSQLRTNLNAANTGDIGTTTEVGVLLANDNTVNFGNVEFAYIIMRNVADPTWLQNNFINWLKNRFAI